MPDHWKALCACRASSAEKALLTATLHVLHGEVRVDMPTTVCADDAD
jgi:hypothetical protein